MGAHYTRVNTVIIRAVCNKNIDEYLKILFYDFRNKMAVNIETHFASKDFFIERNKQTKYYYFCIV